MSYRKLLIVPDGDRRIVKWAGRRSHGTLLGMSANHVAVAFETSRGIQHDVFEVEHALGVDTVDAQIRLGHGRPVTLDILPEPVIRYRPLRAQ